jgi:hypothetical protein
MVTPETDPLDGPSLEDHEVGLLTAIFRVSESDLRIAPHPIDGELDAVSVKFRHGVNLPSALAAFFNSDFYDIPPDVEKLDLHYTPNCFAFVDPKDYGMSLFLSVPRDRRSFMERLKERASDIQYVTEHPEILFMMRPNPNYRQARHQLERGYLPSV